MSSGSPCAANISKNPLIASYIKTGVTTPSATSMFFFSWFPTLTMEIPVSFLSFSDNFCLLPQNRLYWHALR